jgi:hypothetical protein
MRAAPTEMNTLTEKYPDDAIARDYWLGRLDESEVLRHEGEWFASDDAAEYLEAVRDELIQEFLAGALTEDEERSFRSHFLQSPAHVQMLSVADVYRRASMKTAATELAEPGETWLTTLVGELRQMFLRPAFGLVAGVLLIGVFALTILLWMPSTPGPVVSVDVPEPQPGNSLPNEVAQVNTEPAPLPETRVNTPQVNNASRPRPRVQIATIVLSGISRDGNKETAAANVTSETATVRLTFPVPGISASFDSYQAEVTRADGRQVFAKPLPDLSTVRRDSQLTIDVPASRLSRGTYYFRIVGKRTGHPDDTLQRADFRIN